MNMNMNMNYEKIGILLLSIFLSFPAHAQGPLVIDETCTAKEFETLKLKQDCMLNPQEGSSCLLSAMVAAATGSTSAQRSLEALAKDLGPEIGPKLNRFFSRVAELSKDLSRTPISNALKEIKMAANYNPGEWDAVMSQDRRSQVVRSALREVFPNEVGQIEQMESELVKKVKDFRKTNPRIPDDEKGHLRERNFVESLEIKNNGILSRNPKLSLVRRLMDGSEDVQRAMVSANMAPVLAQLSKQAAQNATEAKLAGVYGFIDDVYPVEGEFLRTSSSSRASSSSKVGGTSKRAVGGAGLASLGLAGVFGSSLFNTVRDRIRINDCQGRFGFTEEEMSYLKDGRFFSLKVKATKDCGEFGLFTDDPMKEYVAILKKFNGVPAGICKMVKLQIERLKSISPDSSISNSSCSTGELSGIGYSIKKDPDGAGKFIEIAAPNGSSYKVPWEESELYPDFSSANKYKFSNKDLSENHKKLADLAATRIIRFGNGSGGTYLYSSADDLLAPCEESLYCQLRKTAAVARSAAAKQKQVCELGGIAVGKDERSSAVERNGGHRGQGGSASGVKNNN